MKLLTSFPSTAGLRLRRLLWLSAFSSLLIAGAAINAHAQSANAHSVARLITSSGEISLSSRPRVVNASTTAGVAASTATTSVTSDERRAFDLVNAERRARGESALA